MIRFLEAPAPLFVAMILLLSAAGALLVYRPIWRRRRMNGIALAFVRASILILLVMIIFRPAAELFVPIEIRRWLVVLLDESASMGFPSADGKPRHEQLYSATGDFIASLESVCDVLTMSFGRDVRVVDSGAAAGLSPNAGATDIAGAVRAAGEFLSEKPSAGILLITDGSPTRGGSPIEAWKNAERKKRTSTSSVSLERSASVPVYVLQAPEGDKGTGITELSAPSVARSDQEVNLLVNGFGPDGSAAALYEEYAPGNRRKLVEAKEREAGAFRLKTRLSGAGLHRLVVAVTSPGKDLYEFDNELPHSVYILEPPQILLASGKISWEYSYLKDAIEKMPNVEVRIVAHDEGRHRYTHGPGGGEWSSIEGWSSAMLSRLDAIVLLDLPVSELPAPAAVAIEDALGSGRLGLVLAAGTIKPKDELPDWLPLVSAGDPGPGLVLRAASPARGSFAGLIPEERSTTASVGMTPSRTGEAVAIYEGASGTSSAVIEGRSGLGRVVILGAEFWRAAVRDAGRKAVPAFWQAVVRSVLPEPGLGIALSASNARGAPGEPREIEVLRDPGVDAVSYSLDGPDVALRGEVGEGGGVSFVPEKAGRYNFRAWSGESGRSIEKTFVIDDQFEEFSAPESDRPLMEELARASGGRVVEPKELRDLPREWNEKNRILRRETRDIWDHPFVFGLLVVLWATEWHLRRRWNRMGAANYSTKTRGAESGLQST